MSGRNGTPLRAGRASARSIMEHATPARQVGPGARPNECLAPHFNTDRSPNHYDHSVSQHTKARDDDDGVDLFVVPGNPLGQVDVEVVPGGVRVTAGDKRDGAVPAEDHERDAFQGNECGAGPHPSVEPVGEHCVEKVEDDDVEENPDERVDDFYNG